MEQDARELFNRYADRIYRIAMSYGNSVHFAEDIVQEVFLRYLKKEPRFENHEHEKAWFIRGSQLLQKHAVVRVVSACLPA